ncbi:MAG TPA: hypothetical protein VNW92_04890, partial [Polyangiaceae bacterium]|nr:hypothetical protein [Polyangiaceae bacterium]
MLQIPRRFRNVTLAGTVAVAGSAALLRCGHWSRALGAQSSKPSTAPTGTLPADPSRLENTVMAEDVPLGRSEFSVSADGKRSYFPVGPAYFVFDEHGDFVKRMPLDRTVARTLIPLSNGLFINAQSHALGQLSLLGPDGTQLRALVKRGPAPENLRRDQTGWTSPTAAAFDATHQLLFALDTTSAPPGVPDPDWSRIAVFDAQGKYLRDIAAYDGSKTAATDERRTWYDDIETDPKHSTVYVTARASQQLRAFDYAGTLRGRVPGVAGIAVFPNGNVAVGDPDRHHVRIYDASLHPIKTLDVAGIFDLEADGAGRLYASVPDPAVLYLRWPADLSQPEAIGPRFRRISVGISFESALAGRPFSLPVSVTGRPIPTDDEWHVFARPSDGSNLNWRKLDATYANGTLEVRPPRELLGFNDIAVRYGNGAISRADGVRDLHVEKTVRFDRAPESGSVSVRSLSERSGFRRGEAIAFRVDVRGATAGESVTLALQRNGKTLVTTKISSNNDYWEVSGGLTRRLPPGHYALNATLSSGPTGVYDFDLAEAEAV